MTGYVRLQGAAEPEDVTSDVFLGVFAGLAGFTGDAAGFRSWVFTIAHRRLVDDRRRRSRRPEIPTDDADVLDRRSGDAEQDALAALGGRDLATLFAQLSADQREVLLLRIVADLTVDQTATVLGKSAGAVKALQRRGLAALRRKISPEGVSL